MSKQITDCTVKQLLPFVISLYIYIYKKNYIHNFIAENPSQNYRKDVVTIQPPTTPYQYVDGISKAIHKVVSKSQEKHIQKWAFFSITIAITFKMWSFKN